MNLLAQDNGPPGRGQETQLRPLDTRPVPGWLWKKEGHPGPPGASRSRPGPGRRPGWAPLLGLRPATPSL